MAERHAEKRRLRRQLNSSRRMQNVMIHYVVSPLTLSLSKMSTPVTQCPLGLMALRWRPHGSERPRYAIAGTDKLGTELMAIEGINKRTSSRKAGEIPRVNTRSSPSVENEQAAG